MAGSKKKTKSKKQARAKSAPKGAAPKKSPKKSKAKKKVSSAKKVVAKKKVTARKPPRPAVRQAPPRLSKAFADQVRDCDAGTQVWFIVAGGIEHAVIQKRGSDGAVVIRTDAGMTEVVSLGNLFETADEARAARYR